jgi:hypothetical protein
MSAHGVSGIVPQAAGKREILGEGSHIKPYWSGIKYRDKTKDRQKKQRNNPDLLRSGISIA